MEENTEKIIEKALEQTSTPEETFKNATKKWQELNMSNHGKIDNVILANMFHIPMQDLIDVVEELKLHAVSARAYLGVEDYDPAQNLGQMKLYFTGVNAVGEPILSSKDGQSKIYDFTLPCPPTC